MLRTPRSIKVHITWRTHFCLPYKVLSPDTHTFFWKRGREKGRKRVPMLKKKKQKILNEKISKVHFKNSNIFQSDRMTSMAGKWIIDARRGRVKPLLPFHFESCPCTILNHRKKFFFTYSLKTVREDCENALVFDTLIQRREQAQIWVKFPDK